MTRYYRIIGLVALCFFLAGCSGYRQVAWRTPEQAPEEEEPGDRGGPQAGDKVRVTLVTGARIEGWFVSSSTDSIGIFVETSRYEELGGSKGIEVQTFPLSDIASIEKYGLRWGLTILGMGFFVAIIALIVVGPDLMTFEN